VCMYSCLMSDELFIFAWFNNSCNICWLFVSFGNVSFSRDYGLSFLVLKYLI
jgi:hypothetical protein